MFNLWIRGLILSMQYLVPLVSAIIILRARNTKERHDEITKVVVYFMIQSILNEVEYFGGL